MYIPRREPSTGPTFAPSPPDAVDRRPIGNGGSVDAGPQSARTVSGAGHATTARQVSNLIGLSLPFLGFVVAVVLCWRRFVEPIDLVLLAVGYAATCLGITVGFHRLLTHRAFKTPPAVRYGLAVLGTLAVEGSVIKWVTDHRKHHDFADEAGDPHSPTRGRTRRAEGPVARPRRLAVHHRRPSRPAPVRRRPPQGPRHPRDRRRGEAPDRRRACCSRSSSGS